MRLLVVEDEPALNDQLVQLLDTEGYAVDPALDGQEGLYLGSEYPYDAAIIDLGLPKLNGVELIKQLRQNNHNYPILILTARENWQDKVEGLEAGADDYVTKPFHHEELKARINALIRRNSGHASPVLDFGDLQINTSAKSVTINNTEVELTSYEYNALELLSFNAGKVLSKTAITEHLYEQDFDRDSNVIEVFIGRLRKKLDPKGILKPIATVRGQGYRFNLTKKT